MGYILHRRFLALLEVHILSSHWNLSIFPPLLCFGLFELEGLLAFSFLTH